MSLFIRNRLNIHQSILTFFVTEVVHFHRLANKEIYRQVFMGFVINGLRFVSKGKGVDSLL